MKIKINNAIINFTYQNSFDEFMGESELHVPREVMICYLDNTDEVVDLEKYNPDESDVTPEEIASFNEYEQEQIADWINEGMIDDFITNNADLQIVLFHNLIDDDLEPIELQYYGENPYWLLHDVCHSRNDVSNFSIYVDQYIEEERIFEGMELAKELNLLAHVNCELLNDVEKGFKERWNHIFDKERAIEYLNENS